MIGNQPGNRRPHRRLIGLALALGMVLAGNIPTVVAADGPPVDGGSGWTEEYGDTSMYFGDNMTCNDDGSTSGGSGASLSPANTPRDFGVVSDYPWSYVGTSEQEDGQWLFGPASGPSYGWGQLKLCGKIENCWNPRVWDGKGSFDGIEGDFVAASDVDILFTDLSWEPVGSQTWGSQAVFQAAGRYTKTVTDLNGVKLPSESGTVMFNLAIRSFWTEYGIHEFVGTFCSYSWAPVQGSFQLVKDPG